MRRSRDGVLFGVSIRRLHQTIAEVGGHLDAELSAPFELAPGYRMEGHDIYVLQDGRIALVPSNGLGAGAVYPSRHAYDTTMEQIAADVRRRVARGRTAQHVAYGRFPYGSDFPSLVAKLVDDLRRELRMRRSTLDYTIDSLRTIDRSIVRLGIPEGSVNATIYAPLVAYAGETARRAVDGTWEMVHNKEEEVWEANVHAPGGEVIRPWSEIAHDADEGGWSIAGFMSHVIWRAGGDRAIARATRAPRT